MLICKAVSPALLCLKIGKTGENYFKNVGNKGNPNRMAGSMCQLSTNLARIP